MMRSPLGRVEMAQRPRLVASTGSGCKYIFKNYDIINIIFI